MSGKVHLDDLFHGFRVREPDEMEEAAAQKRVRQFFLIVRRDDDDRTLFGADDFLRLIDVELHPVQFQQQVVREFDIRLVDFIDQQDRRRIGREGLPQLAAHDVVADVMDAFIAQLAVAQAADGVILVETLLCLRGRFDVPFDEGPAQAFRNFACQLRLAGSRLPP